MAFAEDLSHSGFADGARRAARALATFASQFGATDGSALAAPDEHAVIPADLDLTEDERHVAAYRAGITATTSVSASFSVRAEYRTQSKLERIAPSGSDSTVDAGMLARWEFFSYLASDDNSPLAPVVELPSRRVMPPDPGTESADARIVRLPVMRALEG